MEKETRNETCWWQTPIHLMDNTEFEIFCRENKGLRRGISPNNFSFGSFKYCPWCGGKIEWVKREREE